MTENETKRRRAPRVSPLKTIGQVIAEKARVYRMVARNQLSEDKGAKRVYMLSEIRKGMEASLLEEQMQRLEQETTAPKIVKATVTPVALLTHEENHEPIGHQATPGVVASPPGQRGSAA